jgi:hypothetical protein
MSLTKATYSMISGAPANVVDFGADPTGVSYSTTAIQAAFDSGAKMVVFPQGTYNTTGVEIKSGSAIEQLVGVGAPGIVLTTGSNRVALTISKNYVNVSDLIIVSSGSMSDGNSTVGIRQATNVAYTSYTNIRMVGFSSKAIQIRQCVYSQFNNIVIYNSTYGLSLEIVSGIPCTTVTVNEAYFSGCTRGFNGENVAVCTINNAIFEYCGSSIAGNGAFHVEAGLYNLTFPYWEANQRNVVAIDAKFQFIEQYVIAATAANIITYSGVPVGERGATLILPAGINTPNLNADTITNRNLNIGENVIVPVAGGSDIFGNETMLSASGTLTNATWTTVYTIPTAELSGNVNQRAMYEYTCYAGSADLSTGFDSGTIMNSTLRSYSGSTPDWLRLSSNTVQMNVTSSTYGLSYKIVMRRIYPG